MLSMQKSFTLTDTCANEIIPNGWLAHLLTKQKKKVMFEFKFIWPKFCKLLLEHLMAVCAFSH